MIRRARVGLLACLPAFRLCQRRYLERQTNGAFRRAKRESSGPIWMEMQGEVMLLWCRSFGWPEVGMKANWQVGLI